MKRIWITAMTAAAILAAGSPSAEANPPASCATAHEDIAHLEHEK